METFKDQKGFSEILSSFIRTYSMNAHAPASEWLPDEMQRHLPDVPKEELEAQASELIQDINTAQEKKDSLDKHIASGGRSEQWFHENMKAGLSFMNVKDAENYLRNIDDVITDANNSFAKAMLTKEGKIDQNQNLDGIIAEHHHADTYNINAAAQGKKGDAKVLGSNAKDSVDITAGQQNYQLKYGKTAKDTIAMLKKGNYDGQTIIVPKEQVEEVQKAFPDKKVQACVGNEKLHSNELTKDQAKQLQEDVQNGNLDKVYDWDSIRLKDLTYGIAKKIGKAGIMGAASGFGVEAIKQITSDEDPDISKAVKEGLRSGADQGIKAAAAAAIKVITLNSIHRIFTIMILLAFS